jgi:hypothetical protein
MPVNIFGESTDTSINITDNIDLQGIYKIINSIAPSDNGDLANKEYVDQKLDTPSWLVGGNSLTTTAKLGSINDNNITLIRNNRIFINLYRYAMNVGSDLLLSNISAEEDADPTIITEANTRILGCTTLGNGKTFKIYMGDTNNKIYLTKAASSTMAFDSNGELSFLNSGVEKLSIGNEISCKVLIDMDGEQIKFLGNPTDDTDAINKKYMIDNCVNKAKDTMTGSLNMSNNQIKLLSAPTDNSDAVNKLYMTDNCVNKAGDTMTEIGRAHV